MVPYSIYREYTTINNFLLRGEESDATIEIEENMFLN